MLESDGGAGAAAVFWLLLPLLPLGRYRSEGSDRAECSQEPGSGQEREVESEGWEVGRTHRGAANQNKKSREQKEKRVSWSQDLRPSGTGGDVIIGKGGLGEETV